MSLQCNHIFIKCASSGLNMHQLILLMSVRRGLACCDGGERRWGSAASALFVSPINPVNLCTIVCVQACTRGTIIPMDAPDTLPPPSPPSLPASTSDPPGPPKTYVCQSHNSCPPNLFVSPPRPPPRHAHGSITPHPLFARFNIITMQTVQMTMHNT